MGANSDIVMSFIQAWNDMDWDGIDGHFADDVVYHNIPMAPLNGKAQAMEMIRGMQPQSVDWDGGTVTWGSGAPIEVCGDEK